MKSQDEQLDKDFVQCKLTVYCVGEATSNRFKQLKQKTSLFDGCLIRTCASGKQNAMELSKLIVDDFQEIKANTEMLQNENYALYLCSSIRRDDLSIELSKHDVSFDELHVYDTIPCQHAVYKLNSLITERFNTLPLIFMVFFSPSICQAVFDDLELKSKLLEASGNSFRFLSIGPSTSSKLKTYIQSDELKMVHQLDEPSPEALLRLLHELTSQ
jgi:uroporphyrinogen-III synthase